MVMHLKNNLRPGEHEFPCVGPHLLALLANSPLHEKSSDTERIVGSVVRSIRFLLLKSCQRVVRYFASFDSRRTNLDGPYIPWFGDASRHDRFVPRILSNR